MGLADRLKAIETTQPTAIPTAIPTTLQVPTQPHTPSQYVAASAPPLPNTNQQPNYPYNPGYEQVQHSPQYAQQPQHSPQQAPQYAQHSPQYASQPQHSLQYTQHNPHTYTQQTQFAQDINHQQSTTPVKKETGFFASLTNKLMPKSTPQVVYNTPGPYYNAVKQRIDSVIQDKNLHYFYPINSPQYNALLNRVSHVDFPSIAAKRRIPLELALDLAAIAVVDVILFVDDSGSMLFDEQWNQSTEKTDDLKLILSRVVDITSQFDDDGLSLRFFNSNIDSDNITSEQEAMNALAKVHYNGGTPLGRNLLTKVLEPFVYAKARKNQLTKPVMVYIITDGVPDNKQEVKDNIHKCKEWLSQTGYGKSAVNIMFAQVGNSQSAAQYLKQELDNDPDIGDDVDTTGNFEMEYEKYKPKGVDLTPDLWLLQMTLGSLVRAYDEGND